MPIFEQISFASGIVNTYRTNIVDLGHHHLQNLQSRRREPEPKVLAE